MAKPPSGALPVARSEPRSRTARLLEAIALRHQIAVLERSRTRRPCGLDCGGASAGSVTAYQPGSNGNVTPVATISQSNTQLVFPFGVALDFAGNIYVADMENALDVFPAGNDGKVTPSAVIAGEFNSQCTSTGAPFSYCTGSGTGACADNTRLDAPNGIALDYKGNIYVANCGSDCGITGASSITVYTPGSSGNVPPNTTISGAVTGLDGPLGIGMDSSGKIYVTNCGLQCAGTGADSIAVYPPGRSGNLMPIGTIAGSNTQLNGLRGIAIGPLGVATQTVNVQVLENPGTARSNVATGFQDPDPASGAPMDTGNPDCGLSVGVGSVRAGLEYESSHHRGSKSIRTHHFGAESE